ncbi:MAG: hypothetical protein COA34_001315 [Methylophaga sp.]|jgi:hypothetical protein|uniref:hypothetical protein n=1 Tax=Methylophaga sp. TaxID=2024840 RepID=UPI000C0FEC8C|nr:hypothetical protein [Methylophaga sp.]MBL1456494.1 hypothetical protein [Methylophaga sp.]
MKQVERVSKTKQAHKYDLWFRDQVAIALIDANSSNATWVNSEDLRARMKERAEIRKLNN